MQEKDYFNEKNEVRQQPLTCPSCRQTADYGIRWIVRKKKPSLSGGGEDDRARFRAARDYMVRADDSARCSNPRCGRRIEITSKSIVLLDELGPFPQD